MKRHKKLIVGRDEYPWEVGHRLKKSHRTGLSYKEAQKYYLSLKGRKTRFIRQLIPLTIIAAHALQTRFKDLISNVMQENALLRVLRKQNPKKFSRSAKIPKPLKWRDE